MRRFFIAGNWKMNTDSASGVALAAGLAAEAKDVTDVDIAVCPPSVYLPAIVAATAGSNIGVGAQNMYHTTGGAYTGELSGSMLQDVGCQYVILGHSERRNILGESSEDVNKKVEAALAIGLTPIVCVGELLEERQSEQTTDVIRRQCEGSLSGLTAEQMKKVVLAYEPVWAIGTGLTASPEQAEEVHLGIRKLLAARFGEETAESIVIQYGGSVKPSNAAELLSQPNIDGALVGGAALSVENFMGIIKAAQKVG